jgi:hypothetical protein
MTMGKIEDLEKARRARARAKRPGTAAGEQERPAKGRRRCPICRRPAVERFRPFCSARCANEDLGRWIGGAYRIPGASANPLNPQEEDGETER